MNVRRTKLHHLKTDPAVFQLSWDGKKPWEIRKNDRDFQVGDSLLLHETRLSGMVMLACGVPAEYTGRVISAEVLEIVTGYGLQPGWCILILDPDSIGYANDGID